MDELTNQPIHGSTHPRTIEPYNATITHWQPLTERTAVFRVRRDDGPFPVFEPGQFATLGLPREHPPVEDPQRYPPGDPRWKKLWRREYSMASAATETEELEFYAVHVPGGRFTSKLWHAAQHGRLWTEDKLKGRFTLEGIERDRNLVMIASGTGISPYVSMLRTYAGTGRWSRLLVIHGVRHAAELGYHRVLSDFAERDPTVTYVPICSREPAASEWDGMRGHVQDVLNSGTLESRAGFALDPATCHVYLCGNPSMIEDTESLLHERGFATHRRTRPGNIHFERYW